MEYKEPCQPEKQGSPEASQEPDIYKQARIAIAALYQEFEDPKQRTDEIIDKVEPLLKHLNKESFSDKKIEEFYDGLQACASVQDKNNFTEAVINVLKPLLDMKETDKSGFEEAQARAMNEVGDYTEINRLLSYGKSGPVIHLHAVPGESVSNKITLYRGGLRKLAEIINGDPEIKNITASSFLVSEHPGLFTGAGFEVEGAEARISREDFLKRFSK